MKIGILSFAHMHAYSYANALKKMEGVEITGISDENEKRGRSVANDYECTYYKDYQDLLTTDIDAVIICSENVKHAQLVIDSAEAGKHILCEKPLTTKKEEANQMISSCERHNVKLQVAFPMRFSTPVKQVKSMLDENILGDILSMQGTNRGLNPGGWFIQSNLSGGGAVLDHTVHIVDLMRWYLNSEVCEVFAEVDTRFADIEVDDCGLLMFEFENGVIASHDPSWSRPKAFPTWGDVTLNIIGNKGVTQLDALKQHLNLYSDFECRLSHVPWFDDPDYRMVAEFVNAIKNDKDPEAKGIDGWKAVEVALAAYQSSRTGKPVQINH